MAKLNFKGLIKGALRNVSEISVEELGSEYSKYLFEGKTIQTGYKLLRDTIIFTDIRILFVDRQGLPVRKLPLNRFI